MGKAVLKPRYGDMSTVVLGSSVSAIKKAFKKHWDDELNIEGECSDEKLKKINTFLEKNHKTIDEIDEDYSNNFDEDYYFEQTY